MDIRRRLYVDDLPRQFSSPEILIKQTENINIWLKQPGELPAALMVWFSASWNFFLSEDQTKNKSWKQLQLKTGLKCEYKLCRPVEMFEEQAEVQMGEQNPSEQTSAFCWTDAADLSLKDWGSLLLPRSGFSPGFSLELEMFWSALLTGQSYCCIQAVVFNIQLIFQ